MNHRVIGMVLVCASLALPAALQAEEQPPVYSEQDLSKYRNTPDADRPSTRVDTREERKRDARVAKDASERERWCRRASQQRKKIDKAKIDVETAQRAIAKEEEKTLHNSKKDAELRSRLETAKRKLSAEERELADIESEAHRKGIPPGWLRCQAD